MPHQTGEGESLWQQLARTGWLAGRPVHIFEALESTNTHAMELGRQGAEQGTVVAAHFQSRGRGRLGKSWQSPPGRGLYFSLILRPELDNQDLAKVTLATGLAVCEAVDAVAGTSARIKWPNDVLLAGRKVAGILAESVQLPARAGNLVVLGIGLNVATARHEFTEEVRTAATSLLLATGRLFDYGVLLTAIVERVEQRVRILESGGFSELLQAWRRRDATLGRRLQWLAVTGRVVTGVSLGPDAEGHLQVEDQDGVVHRILSGDLSLLV